MCLVVLSGGPTEPLGIGELAIQCLRPAARCRVVGLSGVDQLCSLDAQLVQGDGAEVDEAEVCSGEQDAINLGGHLEYGEWLESGREGDIMKDCLHEGAVKCCACVERRDDDTGIVGDWTEPGIAFGACVELAAAESSVMDAVELKATSPSHESCVKLFRRRRKPSRRLSHAGLRPPHPLPPQ